MLKASALYIVIIIALVIGLICSSLIAGAYFYKLQYQKKSRYDQLSNNLSSGINILLENTDTTYIKPKKISLFSGDADTVILNKISWGIYDIGMVRSFIQSDTLYRTFSIATGIDSAKWGALYLADQDRPFALSGKTTIRGDVFIPKAGVQQAYVDGKAYTGDKRLIIGNKHNSDRQLPPLSERRLKLLARPLISGDSLLPKMDSIRVSWLQDTRYYNFHKKVQTLQHICISGNIILQSDTTVFIDSTAVLKNVLIFAPSIIVKGGFNGTCQLFARDSIHVYANCRFSYPSCLGIIRDKPVIPNSQAKIVLDNKTFFSGIIFTYEKTENEVKPIILLGKNTAIKGQIYSQGYLQLMDQSEIDGGVFAKSFLYRNSTSIFENYLINTTIDAKALSPYYLTSEVMPVAGKFKKVLQWLEAN
jgi:cytoskeletal protein CcmA (bactofilin family)